MAAEALEEDVRPRPEGDGGPRIRWRPVLGITAGLLVLVAVLGLVAGGVHYSNELLTYPTTGEAPLSTQIAELTARGLPAEPMRAQGPLGAYRGVLVPGSADTWVLVVHGRGATTVEAAPLASALADEGRPVLFTSFRNDGLAPDDPDGYATYGDREWRDLQAWVDVARDAGARSIVLYGFSMGGSVVASFLQASSDADVVDAVILDSPLLSMDATLGLQAEAFGIPEPLTPPLLATTKAVSSLRSGMDFAALEHVARWDVDVPALLVHDPGDGTVPDGPTVELAAALGRDAVLVQPDGVGHVGWAGADGARYRARVRRFLDRVGAGT